MSGEWLVRHPVTVLFSVIGFFVGNIAILHSEGRAAAVSAILREGRRAVVSVAAERVDPANEGRLVHLTGLASSPQKLVDPDFGVAATVVLLKRVVEMYQWDEICHEETVTKDGKSETTCGYSYSRIWYPEPIISEKFHPPAEHPNPPPAHFVPPSLTIKPPTVHLGAFQLSPEIMERIAQVDPLPLGEIPAGFFSLPFTSGPPLPFQGGVYLGKDPAVPEIGDRRVRYLVAKSQPVSLIARQVGNTFAPFTIGSGSIHIFDTGTVSPEELLSKVSWENQTQLWLARLFSGFWISLSLMILGPLLEIPGYSIFSGSGREGVSFKSRLKGAVTMTVTIEGIFGMAFASAWVMGILASALLLGTGVWGKWRPA